MITPPCGARGCNRPAIHTRKLPVRYCMGMMLAWVQCWWCRDHYELWLESAAAGDSAGVQRGGS